ncbi:hypothetical protein JI721_10050 [Alicyclobacillus cycloheptanicus]|uniref:Anti-sigma factor RsiW n=1 Tax=Alicyclobacillus cycloheptanicus TaxID=1457 RepID=A0ABT9XIY5_9BACL|nr:hypothetical protein [Alicyclobacillus cycloheptanicus]MDQ0189994.1 anti-sigma factor RsiW [Alicyclobacillus cycloheptanicus]WDM00097.1 hypothetical protein JI721_10050 [Alicyclobacillus cycloheptanicus]
MKLSIPSIGRAWAFENGHYAVVVVEAGNVPIDPTAYRELPTRHGVGLYQWSDGASTLSYSDAGKRIWIAGNIKQEDSQRFANRLPEVTSAFFPLRSQSGN